MKRLLLAAALACIAGAASADDGNKLGELFSKVMQGQTLQCGPIIMTGANGKVSMDGAPEGKPLPLSIKGDILYVDDHPCKFICSKPKQQQC